MRYPRDLLGYGGTPPAVDWPQGAALALQIVVNFEEGGERCLLHGDRESEAFLSEIPGAEPWPGQRHWNMETLYDYGARAGFWRLHRLLTARGVPVTVFGVASALARAPAQVAAMQAAGWEIASHAMRWIDYRDWSAEDERAEMAAAVRLHAAVTGEAPRGWYTGRCSVNTVEIATAMGCFDYVSDSYADDLPYWHEGETRAQLIVPYTLDANDMRFSTVSGFSEPRQFEVYLCDSFDALLAEGRAGRPAMMNVGLHCRLAGRPGRAAALARFLDHVQGHSDVWIARRIDIARHWAARHPFEPRDRPSRLSREAFVARFGGVFEHSPWVAERAWDAGLGAVQDTAEGLGAAMVTAFRLASEEERLAVLRAHPDLAGKLAAAKRLTAESAAEQASAGLDALTDDRRARFEALNAAYRERFGIPFIVAVRGLTADGILARFETRIAHDRATEIAAACAEVERIARLRLQEMLP